MNWSLEKKVALGFVLILGLFSILSFYIFRNILEFERGEEWLNHTNQVLEQITLARAYLKEAESSQRGYLITEQEAYLDNYYDAKSQLLNTVLKLGTLTSDNQSQSERNRLLKEQVLQRTTHMDSVVEVRQKHGESAVVQFVSNGLGYRMSRNILNTLDTMRTEETRLLQLRSENNREKSFQLKSILISSGLFFLLSLTGLFMLISNEIKNRQKSENALLKSKERYTLAEMGTNDGLWDWELAENKIYFSPRWKLVLGYTNDELPNHSYEWFTRIHDEDRGAFLAKIDQLKSSPELGQLLEYEVRIRNKQNKYIWVLVRGIVALDEKGKPYRIAGSMSDVSIRKAHEDSLFYKATHDAITGLFNKEQITQQLDTLMAAAHRHNMPLSICMCDLDKFKKINDTYGHLAGDKLIVSFAELIKEEIRKEDMAARFGGDEFCIVFPYTEAEKVKKLLDRIRWTLQETEFKTDQGETFHVTGTFGVAQLSIEIKTPEELMELADQALYQAKHVRNRVLIYDPNFVEPA